MRSVTKTSQLLRIRNPAAARPGPGAASRPVTGLWHLDVAFAPHRPSTAASESHPARSVLHEPTKQ